MTYPQAIKYLESFVNYEKFIDYPYKQSLKLERIKDFLFLIGNPQSHLRCIHIAGTKGKGSTCAFITYILREAGFRVGLYTSPHLSDFRERIRVLEYQRIRRSKRVLDVFEGMVSRRSLTALVKKLKPAIDKYNKSSKYGPLSFFEVYTALAFVYFREQETDFAVLETGLGGRLDATNTVDALISVITPISYEHTQKLGKTLREIATEKAGIIKDQGSRVKAVVISAPQEKEAANVIRNRCKEVGVVLQEINMPLIGISLPLLGYHQRINAAVAVSAVKALKLGISQKIIRRGLLNTQWPGRFEVVARDPLVVLDGAQNIASVKALKETVRNNFKYNKLILVLGISKDKDIKGICNELYGLADQVILTCADNPRAEDPKVLSRYFKGREHFLTRSLKEARQKAMRLAAKDDLILGTGSLFVVGELRNA
ncbi:MAG: bifunctional folylpolyglutamate synthase/dihydrofolate synthase [Candidatus Omnitrophica bacterium]|nr:bifunctional folylpolyglutamate synthase/dihydrofolate synthase [Candidatus Omnitrophota bacterium]